MNKGIISMALLEPLSTTQRLTLAGLGFAAKQREYKCFPSMDELVKSTGLAKRTLRRELDNLEKKRIIKREKGHHPLYTINRNSAFVTNPISVDMIMLAMESETTYAQKLVLLICADYTNDKYMFWPAQETIARRGGLYRNTVYRALKFFCDVGVLIKISSTKKNNIKKYLFLNNKGGRTGLRSAMNRPQKCNEPASEVQEVEVRSREFEVENLNMQHLPRVAEKKSGGISPKTIGEESVNTREQLDAYEKRSG